MRHTCTLAVVVTLALGLGGSERDLLAQAPRSADARFKAAVHKEEVEGNLKGAIDDYLQIVAGAGTNRALAAEALVRMAACHQKLGDADARKVYERVVREYADQADATSVARSRLTAMDAPRAEATRTAARQVWSGSGVDNMGGPSPDGRFLSFTDWSTGDLAIRTVASGTNRRLTDTRGWVASGDFAGESVFSPDGQTLAYAWFVESANSNQLRIMSASGGGAPRTLVDGGREYVRPFAWSPDGRSIHVVRFSTGAFQIGVVAVADGSFRVLKSLEQWQRPVRLSLSPDGRYVAYDAPVGGNGSQRDIFVLSTDARRETLAVQSEAEDVAPIWSADGAQLLFISDRTGGNSLWAVAVHEGAPAAPARMVRADVGSITPLGVTRSGTFYYSLNGRARQNIYSADIDASGTARTPVLAVDTFVNANTGPAWSPDGASLAYFSHRQSSNRRPALVVHSARTAEERTVSLPATFAAPFNASPRWFPDGRSMLIVCSDATGPGAGFYRLTLETGQVELIHGIAQNMSSFDLSRDGRTIVWAHQNNGQRPSTGRLLRYDIESRQETELDRDKWFITVAVSPDGKHLAYVRSIRENTKEYPSTLSVMPLTGGPAREVYRDPTWIDGSRYNSLTWSADQLSLIVGREGDPGNILWRVPIAGGSPTRIGVAMAARIKSLGMHPDGKRLTFSAVDADTNEIWTLEHFLPAATTPR
jgi:Tol biopolymer transport system component